MHAKVHRHPQSPYNQQTTTVVVTHPQPGAVVTPPIPIQGFIPGYVPHQYNPNQFFPMQQQQPAPHYHDHHHGHDPHVHGHGYGNMHGHK